MSNSNYLPIAHQIDESKDILTYKESPEFSKNIDYSAFFWGFQHFIHQSKDKMEIVESFKGKKQVYYIINEFERSVDDYDQDINNTAKSYFDLKTKPNILSRAFFKLWELFFMFDLVDIDNKNFVSAHLAEGPGSFIQATMFYRDKFTEKGISKNDKYYAVTLHNENVKKHVPKLEENFVKYYEKEKPVRFVMHKTYSKAQSGGAADKDNGDLTDIKTRILFGGNFKDKKADLVTADGGFDWGYENIQEQEALKLILSQIVMAIEIQAKGGNFVCKFYESFTTTTAKMINMLKNFYKDVYLVKPLMSRASNSEKYAVCMNFTDPKDKKTKIEKINNLIETMNKHKNLNLVNVFPEFEFDDSFKSALIKINIEIANKQFKTINEMITFIEKQNYRGEEYTQRREKQINASKYWIDNFFPEVKEFKSKRNSIKKSTVEIVDNNKKSTTNLQKKLDFA
ncbi:FtsJ-like methyltransferase [Indivirus ILV1]|uniref:FtsJ-like methyltransferase n=1 Tax=Indivirus ILV1 TaxID=1977633 RepID=A0A1V0SD51_9VIRU|nr:FtsJ-like methyltransferase [Indivirus ILV1]